VNSKAKDVLFGGGKSSGQKSYDKLGMNKPQAELFGKNPKAYHTLGASTQIIVQQNHPDATTAVHNHTLCEGYLTKRGEKVKNWKQRWCHLTAGGILSYHASEEAAKKKNPEPKGVIDCNKAVIRLADQHDYQQIKYGHIVKEITLTLTSHHIAERYIINFRLALIFTHIILFFFLCILV